MLKLNIDIIFQYIYFITRLYIPSDFNKQKIKKLFECIPFFVPSAKDQQLLFHLIQQYSIINYYDTTDNLFYYGYIIYQEYHKHYKISYLDMYHYIKHYDYIVFLSEQKRKLETKKKVSILLFISVILICIYSIYVH